MLDVIGIIMGLDQVPDEDCYESGMEDAQPDDIVKGVVGIRERKLIAFVKKCSEEKLAEAEALRSNLSKMTPAETIAKAQSLKSDIETLSLLKDVFWRQVRTELGISDKLQLLIKKGWVVIEEKTERPTTEPRFEVYELVVGGVRNCGNPDCPLHGHLNRQEEQEETAPVE